MSKVLIIIPAYNEEKSIKKTIENVHNSGYDFVVVNDGSTDSTKNILSDLGCDHINLISNLGIGGAMQTGYKYACENNYDIAIQFDADGQHNMKYIDAIIAPLNKGEADFVIGSRFIKKNSSEFKSTFARRVGINIISFFIKLLSGKKIYDVTSGFRGANKSVIKHFAENYPVEYPEPVSEFDLIRSGYRVSEVPVSMNKRACGRSSINLWKKGYYVINVTILIILIKFRSRKKHA